jgi:serine/threonine protein kinase
VADKFFKSLQNSKLAEAELAAVKQASRDLGDDSRPDALLSRFADSPLKLLGALRIVARIDALGYRVIRPIGEGGGGRVFLVEKEGESDRLCALKVLRHDMDTSDFDARVKRFIYEAEMLRKMKGVAVPRLYQAVTETENPLFVMEYIRGENLGQLFRDRGRLETTVALDLILQAALVIDELARKKVVHRDIKPENLILDRMGKLWVVDFGLARKEGSSHSGVRDDVVGGTDCYMAPEHHRLNPMEVDARADVYSLGCTLFFLIQGKCPRYVGDAERMRVIRDPDLSWTSGKATEYLLEKMLAESREERLTPEDLVNRLKSLLSELRRRNLTLLDDCVENLRVIDPAWSDASRVYDEVDRHRLLLLCGPAALDRNALATCVSFIDGLERVKRIGPVESATLKLLARRRGVVRQMWPNESGLVVQYQPRDSEDIRVLKVMPLAGDGASDSTQRTEDYFGTIKGLRHPNVAPLAEIGREGETFFADMEFVDGRHLLAYRGEGGVLAWSKVSQIFNAVLSAVAEFHRLRVAHGDIQPSNVIIPSPTSRWQEGVAVLIGFGNKVDAPPRDDLRKLGHLLLFLISGQEPDGSGLSPKVIREQYSLSVWAVPDGLTGLLDYLLFDAEATINRAREMWSQLTLPPVAPPGQVVSDHMQFLELLRGLGGEPKILPQSTEPGPKDRAPLFLLFERASRVIMAVIPEGASVHPSRLQKTTEIECGAKPIPEAEVKKLGFTPGQVNPAFLDPKDQVAYIIIDATLLAHAILDPGAPILMPGNANVTEEPVRIKTTIGAWLKAVFRMHGTRKIFFANIARGAWPDQKILDHLDAKPIHTRFAPTPSGGLHLGNARTALVSYLVALRSGLKHSPDEPTRFFHLRIDDTDLDRCEPGAEEQVKDELRWLGLTWDEERGFSQTDEVSRGRYGTVERALRDTALLAHDPFSQVSYLKLDVDAERDSGGYFNLLFDLRRGPLIFHSPPQDKERRHKVIQLTRSDGTPFYRFAGCVDDIARTTIAFRDRGQFELSVVQSHIRHGIERLRQLLCDMKAAPPRRARLAADLKRVLGMHERADSIPLVIYGHLQVLVDQDGAKLSKRDAHGGTVPIESACEKSPFDLRTLRPGGISSEAILAYLLVTILKPKQGASRRDHLHDLVRIFALAGQQAALMIIAQEFELQLLVQSPKQKRRNGRKLGKNIRCNLRWVRRANYWFINALPPWKCARLFDDQIGPRTQDVACYPHADLSEATRSRIYTHRADFADLRQIHDVVNGPAHPPPAIDQRTEAFIRRARAGLSDEGRNDPAQLVGRVLEEIGALRECGCGNPRERAHLHTVLGDLRRLLTGSESSPKIETILRVLEPAVVDARIELSDVTEPA